MERVRFAPSPTGPLHIGGVRTALFNYLYTKSRKGVFVVRVEDTDQNRYVPGAEEYILKTMDWLGLEVDEGPGTESPWGPYRQSERKDIYQNYIQKLIEKGKAYYAFDSKEALELERGKAEAKKEAFKYGQHNRHRMKNSLSLNTSEVTQLLKNEDYVIRLKNDALGTIKVQDELRGNVHVEAIEIDDKILMKADGMPTYHFANVVDDHLMEITCVIRGEEWLPSLPIHQLIYEGFGWEAPKFIHLPLILKPEGKGKLSKRDGSKGGFPVFPFHWEGSVGFRERGFIKEGLVNYLALLGWNSGTDRELFSLKELVDAFGIEGLQKGGARFDYKKALWINAQHIKGASPSKLIPLLPPHLKEINSVEEKIELIKDRVETLLGFNELLGLFEENPTQYDKKAVKKLESKSCKNLLTEFRLHIESGQQISKSEYMGKIKDAAIKTGQGMQALRIALVGQLAGPDLFAFMDLLPKSVILERLDNFIKYLNQSL